MDKYVLQQQQPEVLLTPQVVNLNPQMTGPFNPQLLFPNQGNQFPPGVVPNGQEQFSPPLDPNLPNFPQQSQNTFQMFPSFQYPPYGFPQYPSQQGFPYFVPPYGYPRQRTNVMLQPNNGQQTLERVTQRPQLPLQRSSQPKVQTERKESTTLPPDPRGDASGPGIDEGQSNFPFLFEP
ncbi:uncharacterized protein [Brachionichthys hirsutus]|uniref:uncharacterized protein n=1 Tax=Brachionichthys hirsutus TaxID=412623 RepID=UPI003605415C